MSIYKINESGELNDYFEIYSENEASLSLDQGILECITVTEEEFKELLN